MGTKKSEALFYIVVKDARTRPKYKTKMITIYSNGVPTKLDRFVPWLARAIDEKVGKKK